MKTKTLLLILVFSHLCLANGFAQTISSNLKKHVEILASDSLEGRGLGTEGHQKAMLYIENQFREAGLKAFFDTSYRHTFSFEYGRIRQKGVNVIAIIEGSDEKLKHEYIIIGAHYDHLGFQYKNNKKTIWNGADDNASGVSVLIETGRKLNASQAKLKRSILIVAFDAEEIGLLGSEKMLKDSLVPHEKIKLMFSIDMVGRYKQNMGLNLNGISMIKGGKDLALSMQKELSIKLKKTDSKKSYRSDCRPFIEHGIPSSHIETGLGKTYHTPDDVPETLNYNGMKLITEFITMYCTQLAQNIIIEPRIKLRKRISNERKPTLKREIALGRSHFNFKNSTVNSKNAFSANIGISTKIRLNNFIDLKPELLYSLNGGSDKDGKVSRHSLCAPVNLNIYTLSTVHVNLGIYYSRHLYGTKGNGSRIDFRDDYEPNEFGINTGFRFKIYKNLNMEYRSSYGLTNIYSNNSEQRGTSVSSMFILNWDF